MLLLEASSSVVVVVIIVVVVAVHKQGIVHRDLKPDNLLVTSDWIVKIADFGVSKKLEEKDGGQCADTAGTYPFMSPQIASGEK